MRGLVLLAFFALATSTVGFDVEKDVRFDLYTPTNPTRPQTLSINDLSAINNTNFNFDIPIRMFVHGYRSTGKLRRVMTNAYFIKGKKKINLIAVNWEKASTTINYIAATRYVEKIGIRAADFIDAMVDNNIIKMSELKNISIIGFSLGAHIAGITGKKVRSGKIGRIVGLDPTSVLFSLKKPNERLDSQDAMYVETIHTSKLGFFKPIGIASFYPNGGRKQPGCSWDITGKCSHQAAYEYFAESIYSDEPFIGYFCESLINIRRANCSIDDRQMIMGGEPGEKEQSAGIYYISISKPKPPIKRRPKWYRRIFQMNYFI